MGLNPDEILNYMNYSTLNTFRKISGNIKYVHWRAEDLDSNKIADSRYPITVKRNIFKRFAVKWKQN